MPTLGWEEQQSSKDNAHKDHDQPQQDQRPAKLENEVDASSNKPILKNESTDTKNGDGPTSTVDVNRLNVNFGSQFDSDRKDVHLSSFHFDRNGGGPLPMPHRVDPYLMSSSHRRHYDPYDRRQSPPPITTLTHSPSPSAASLDRGGVSTPPIRRPSPHSVPAPHLYPAYPHPHPHPHDPALLNSRHHFIPRESIPHGYMYQHPHQLDPRYDPHSHGPPQPHDGHPYSPYHHPSGLPHPGGIPMHPPAHHPHAPHHPQHVRDPYGHPYPAPHPAQHPTPPVSNIIHTDDAATKLSDRVRRRCFNCCTTDTSTWRRSNLSPGKVLCNKCGLFERTHSRPRPEQFPHKRGPLATSTLRSRSPTQAQAQPQAPPGAFQQPQQPQVLPPITPSASSSSNPASSAPSPSYYTHPPPPPPLDRREYNNSGSSVHGGPPGSASGGNTPLHPGQTQAQGNGSTAAGTTLPGLQTWTTSAPTTSTPAPAPSGPAGDAAPTPPAPAQESTPGVNGNGHAHGSPKGIKENPPSPQQAELQAQDANKEGDISATATTAAPASAEVA